MKRQESCQESSGDRPGRSARFAYPCRVSYFLANARGDRRGLGVCRGGAAAVVRRPPGPRRGRGRGRHPGGPAGRRRCTRRWRRPIRTLEFSKVGADDLAGLDVVFLALPHGESQDAGSRRWSTGSGSSWTCPPTSGCATPAPTRGGTGTTTSPPSCSERFAYGLPELFRRRAVGGPAGGGAGVLPDRGGPGARAAGARRGDRDRPASSWTPPAACRARGASCRTPRTSTPSTRTSPPTVCSHHRHTPEIEQATGAQVLFTPHLAPMNRGILATCYAVPDRLSSTPTTSSGVLRDAYAGEPFVVVSESVAVDQGHARVQLRAPHGARRPPHGVGARAVRARQPGEGGVGPGACSAPTSRSACPRARGSPPWGCTRERHRAPRVRGLGAGVRDQGVGCPRPGPGGVGARGRCPPPACSPPTWPRPRRCR